MAGRNLEEIITDIDYAYEERCKGDCYKCKLDFCYKDALEFLKRMKNIKQAFEDMQKGDEWR